MNVRDAVVKAVADTRDEFYHYEVYLYEDAMRDVVGSAALRGICNVLGLDYETVVAEYTKGEGNECAS